MAVIEGSCGNWLTLLAASNMEYRSRHVKDRSDTERSLIIAANI